LILHNNKITGQIADWLILISIGICCLGYSIFWSTFAELNIQLSFLNFPIFIGEILLFFCSILLFLKWSVGQIELKRWHIFLALYVVWIFIKAAHGYLTFGPLAFRNAALFYYPLFAVIGYHIYREKRFNQVLIYIFIGVLFISKIKMGFHPYVIFPTFLIFCILILQLKWKWQKYLLFFSLIFLYPYKSFFVESKADIIANIVTFLFLTILIGVVFANIKKKYIYYFAILSLVVILFGFYRYSSMVHIKAITSPMRFIERIELIDQHISGMEKTIRASQIKCASL